MLHQIRGKNRWCGPAAVATITGLTTDEVSRQIRERLDKRMVTRTTYGEISECLRWNGFVTLKCFDAKSRDRNTTVAAWLRLPRDMGAVYLVEVTGHWIVVRGRKIADNLNRGPVFLRQFKGRRKRVKRAWKLRKIGGV